MAKLIQLVYVLINDCTWVGTRARKKTKNFDTEMSRDWAVGRLHFKVQGHNNLSARKKNKNEAHNNHGLTPNAAPLLYLLDA